MSHSFPDPRGSHEGVPLGSHLNANEPRRGQLSVGDINEHEFLVNALNKTAIVAVTDVKGRILTVNDKFCEISGYSRDELIGQDHRILKSGVHSQDEFRQMYRIIASGQTWRGEFCNRAKSGRTYWVDTTIIPRLGKRGKVVGYTSIRIDITTRKEMEQALRRSEQLNRSIMMALGEGVVVQNRDGIITSFNPAAKRILGLCRDPETGDTRFNPNWSLVREDGCGLSLADHPAMVALSTGEAQRNVLIGLKKEHEDIWIVVNSIPIVGASGEVESVVTSFSDVTERLRSKQLLNEAIATIPDGFALFDRGDRLVMCNDAYRAIYAASERAIKPGASLAEMLEFGLRQGQYPEAGETIDQRSAWLARRLALHERAASDTIQRLPNGRWLQIRERRAPSGYVVGFHADISDVRTETLRLRTIIDGFPGAIALFDGELNLAASNETFRTSLDLPAELFGQEAPSIEMIFRVKASQGEYGHTEAQQIRERLELVRRNEPFLFQHVRPNGAVLEVHGIPIPEGGFIVTYIDITARHSSEKKLAESEQIARTQSETLKLTLAHMSQGLSMFDENDQLIVWNERFVEIYQISPTLLQNTRSSWALSNHLIKVGFIETSEKRWREKIEAGETFSARITNRDGRVIKVVYTPVFHGGWVATHEDITDRVQSQAYISRQSELLRQSCLQLDAALDNMSQGLIMLNAHGEVVLTNRCFRDMYGLSMDEVSPGKSVRDIVAAYTLRHKNLALVVDRFVGSLRNELSQIVRLDDGRVVQIKRAAMPDGGWVATHEDISERERAAEQILHLAFHDPLTGLANRAEFNRTGEELLKRKGGLSVLLVDLDRFKSVNDTLGHAAGDQLLKMAADRMMALARPIDVVARIGGDEFAIIQGTERHQHDAAVSLATRLTEVLAQPYDLGGRPLSVGASVGVAVRADADSMESLVHRADLALYEVKSSGRNSFKIYDDELGVRAEERLELEGDLRDAIYSGQLELHYQPIVSMIDRQISEFEALVRWRHPRRGLLSPDRFISLAEESGLIVPLGEFVVRQACSDALKWPRHIKVAVNISPMHLLRKSLLDTVTEVFLQTKLDPDRLEIEVTETVLMKSDDDLLTELHQLQDLGIQVALDDFGTGCSSLSYLRMFPFNKIKIDRSFVSEIMTRSDSAAIVCAVTGLARSLGMQTTAEGIETEDQFQILKAAGCTMGQGYLFGKPLPINDKLAAGLVGSVQRG